MIRFSIKRKIIGIALVLIVLMAATALISLGLVTQVSHRLEDLSENYVPAYGALARANIRTLERAVALRRMIIRKMQLSPDDRKFAAARISFEDSAKAVTIETQTARRLIDGLIAKGSGVGGTTALVRLDTSLLDAMNDVHRQLDSEINQLLPLLDSGDQMAVAAQIERVDALRGEFDRRIDGIRADISSCYVTSRRRRHVSKMR
jgi:adenylate cyclase